MAQNHIIKQQIVELACNDKQMAQDVFTETSRLFNDRIFSINAEVFDKHVDPRQIIRLEKLELDMQIVSFPFSVEEFVQNYKRLLEEALLQHLRQLKAPSSEIEAAEVAIASQEISDERLLEHYLLTGGIGWWASPGNSSNPLKIFETFLHENKEQLKFVLAKLFPQKNVRKRLAYQFENQHVKEIIRILEPSEADFIEQYHSKVSHLKEINNFIQAEQNEFKKVIWLFILNFLADNSGSRFNRKMFVKSTLNSLAIHYNISFERVLFYFAEAADILEENFQRNTSLTDIIRELSVETGLENISLNGNFGEFEKSLEEPAPLNLEDVLHFLVRGYFSTHKSDVGNEQASEIFIQALNKKTSKIIETSLKYGKTAGYRQRLIQNLGEKAVKKTIEFIEPGGAQTIFDYADYTLRLHHKKQLANIAQKEFGNSLWDFILSYLFSENSSVFNSRMFLEQNIRQLAAHYNLNFKTTLALLVQAVGEESTINKESSGLFFNLLEILKEENKKNVSDENNSDLLEISGELLSANLLTEKETSTYRKHILFYWLQHGSLPWWSAKVDLQPEQLLEDFFKSSPSEAVSFFKLAIGRRQVRADFFILHAKLAQQLMLQASQNSTLKYSFDAILQNNTLKQLLGEKKLSALITLTLARVYENSLHSSIDLNQFLETFFAEVRKVSTKEIPLTTYSELLKSKELENNQVLMSLKKNKQLQGVQILSEPGNLFNYSDVFIEDIIKTLVANESLSGNHLDNAIMNELHYYLVHGTFTNEDVLKLITDKRNLFISLTRYLSKKNPSLLKSLFENPSENEGAPFYLYEVFSSSLLHNFPELKISIFNYLKHDLFKLLTANEIETYRPVLQPEDLLKKVDYITESDKKTALLKTLLRAPFMQAHAALHYKGVEFTNLLRNLAGDIFSEQARRFLYIFGLVATDSFEREKIQLWIKEFFFLKYTQGRAGVSDIYFLQEFVHFIHYQKQANISILYRNVSKVLLNSGTQDLNVVQLLENAGEALSYFVKKDELKKELEQKEDEEEEDEEEEPGEEEMEEEEPEEGEHIYITNAGLVLLHPFLPHLFERTNLTEKFAFHSEIRQSKASYLLQFVATGLDEAEENEMILNKILSGMQPTDVLMRQSLTDEDKLISGQMVGAVLQQWDKLKNTSPEGFRNSFLMRPGYLLNTSEAWILRVEQRGYDILLQTLPWSFGMVKFSWMKKPIIVEWT